MRGVGVEVLMCFETLCLAVFLVAYGGPYH